jgi:NAD(P)-dependent dehydrogenase (short-subunit alcohol dehydrogenase family)
MSVVLITGAGTGIGKLTAKSLVQAGHHVWASMRDPLGRNQAHAQELLESTVGNGGAIDVVDLDVTSQDSADSAVATVIDGSGQLDVVIHNAGHLFVGYVEAFTAEDIHSLFNTNTFGVQRLNRAALPHMRERRAGTLLYVGSTIPVTTPPFLGPYVASKAAMDSLALVTSYEVNPFGIETVIVMPGPFTKGTEHFPNASQAADHTISAAYAALDPLVARNEAATANLIPSDVDADPQAVADEIARVLALPIGGKPFRTVVDFSDSGVSAANDAVTQARTAFVERMGFGELLTVRTRV